MPIVFFFVVLLEISHSWGACAFYAPIYSFQFNSIHFNSFHFYSIQRDEKNETLRMITKKTKITKYYENYEKNEKNENYEILRKKGKMLLKKSR